MHDPVLDVSVEPNVRVVGVHAQHERPRGQVLQDPRAHTVVLTLGETSMMGSLTPPVFQQIDRINQKNNNNDLHLQIYGLC